MLGSVYSFVNRLALWFRVLIGLFGALCMSWKHLALKVLVFMPLVSVKNLLLIVIRAVRVCRVVTPVLSYLSVLIVAAIRLLLTVKGTLLGLTVVNLADLFRVCRVLTLVWIIFCGNVA